jgi:hypothetical protein
VQLDLAAVIRKFEGVPITNECFELIRFKLRHESESQKTILYVNQISLGHQKVSIRKCPVGKIVICEDAECRTFQ